MKKNDPGRPQAPRTGPDHRAMQPKAECAFTPTQVVLGCNLPCVALREARPEVAPHRFQPHWSVASIAS